MAGIILPFDIRENKLWEPERPRTKLEAWIDLSLLAQTEDTTSERKLAERWKWSKTKTRNFLSEITKDHQKDQKKTGLHLTELALLEITETKKEPPKRPPKTEGKSNTLYTPEFEAWYSSWPRQQAREDSAKNFSKRRKEHGLDFILQCSKNYLDSLLPEKMEYAYASNNFFGQKAYYLGFKEPPKNIPTRKQDDDYPALFTRPDFIWEGA